MDAVTLSQLRKPRTFPAVSVLMPTSRHAPENQQDPIRLRNLLAEVRRRLRADGRISPGTADEVVHGLEAAAGEVDLAHAGDALVLLAAPAEHHAFMLAQPVDERVVVDTTFVTRDLVAEYTRSRRYWVLALSDRRVRLLDGFDDELAEISLYGFPMRHRLPEDAAEGAGKLDRPPRTSPDERQRQFFREVGTALDRVLAEDRRPVVVAGVTRHHAFFDEVAGPAVTVAGRIEGCHETTSPHDLAVLARPVLAAYEDLREVAVLAELEAARNARRYAAGLDETTRLAEEGRAAHLVVERGYYAPALRDGDTLILIEGDASLYHGDVIDDVVDHVIETVLDYGGDVTFVSDGFLIDHDRIAMVVRY
ncbi:hypothetical protein DPM19_22155 [Actinomadura craniellae]|uniref:Chemotaxis protein n=1 Tax=Actinomadura craniellae TaxID=2231787 RepID=A0A365H266_9ACTN|nr:hypothetical protein [Actinomadura craniellae]RAY13194.1 hypothetical protein DPM19_22155 [Actinomadura craniellae]